MLGLLFRLEQKRQLLRQKMLWRQLVRQKTLGGGGHFALLAAVFGLVTLIVPPIGAPVALILSALALISAITIIGLPFAALF